MAGLGGTGGGAGPHRSGRCSGGTGRGLGTAAVGPGHIAPEPAGLLWGDEAIGGVPWGQQGWEPLLERQTCKPLRSYDQTLRPSGCKRTPQPLRPSRKLLVPRPLVDPRAAQSPPLPPLLASWPFLELSALLSVPGPGHLTLPRPVVLATFFGSQDVSSGERLSLAHLQLFSSAWHSQRSAPHTGCYQHSPPLPGLAAPRGRGPVCLVLRGIYPQGPAKGNSGKL